MTINNPENENNATQPAPLVITAADTARAAQFAKGVLDGDDAMANDAINAAAADPREESVITLLYSLGDQMAAIVWSTMGEEAGRELFRRTLADARGAEASGS